MALSDERRAFIPRDFVEPAHNIQIETIEGLVSIYRYIKENYQSKIDAAFDRAAKEIGFVVVTALPATIEIGANAMVKNVAFAADNLADTVFDRHVLNEVMALKKDKISGAKAGTYNIHLIWLQALKIKMRRDWVEPAHFRFYDHLSYRNEIKIGTGVHEPVHYYPGFEFDPDRQILVQVLDEVYPELRIAEQVRAGKALYARQAALNDQFKATPGPSDWLEPVHCRPRPDWLEPAHYRPRPDWLEPAHYRPRPDWLEPVHYYPRTDWLKKFKARFHPDWLEPVHYRPDYLEQVQPIEREANVLSELAGILKKYGY